nr:hypothetical protein [Tanacetum cinerariifolium]
MTLDDFRTIFHLPQATDNNHDCFVPAPKFSGMVPFYINNLSFTLELRSPSNFKTTGLVQPWQTLCKMFSRCMTTRVTGYDQPPIYSLKHPTTLIPYPRFTKLITVIRLLIPSRRSTQLTPPTPILTTDDIILQDTIQLSLAELISHEELEAKKNEEIFKEHLMSKELGKLVEGTKNESLEVEITVVVLVVHVIEEEEESVGDDYELRRREKGEEDDPHDNSHHEGENSAKRQKTSEHGTYVSRESSSGQVNKSEPCISTLVNQEQLDDFNFWMDSYATNDDELPTKKVSQELVEQMSQTIDEVKLRKVVNEMLREQCTSGDEHQYHIDQMQNFLKNDIVWESKREILVSPHP